jgi:hypothetical protein
VTLIALGGIQTLLDTTTPKDQYGFTEGDRQQFVAGCGGGEFCECLFTYIEQNMTRDEVEAESRRYVETGSFSPEMMALLTDVVQTSGCVP